MNENIPDFASWHHATLVLFATEANEVIKRQRELIQLYRVRMTEDDEAYKRGVRAAAGVRDARKTD